MITRAKLSTGQRPLCHQFNQLKVLLPDKKNANSYNISSSSSCGLFLNVRCCFYEWPPCWRLTHEKHFSWDVPVACQANVDILYSSAILQAEFNITTPVHMMKTLQTIDAEVWHCGWTTLNSVLSASTGDVIMSADNDSVTCIAIHTGSVRTTQNHTYNSLSPYHMCTSATMISAMYPRLRLTLSRPFSFFIAFYPLSPGNPQGMAVYGHSGLHSPWRNPS